MTAVAKKTLHTFAEYLAREAEGPVRHEYVNGEILAMAGGSIEHGRLCMSLGSELRAGSDLSSAMETCPLRTLPSSKEMAVVVACSTYTSANSAPRDMARASSRSMTATGSIGGATGWMRGESAPFGAGRRRGAARAWGRP